MKSKKTDHAPQEKPPSVGKKPHGRPSLRTPEVEQKIIDGLSVGTPLTIICKPDEMPCDDTVRTWANDDEAFSRAIARARSAGFDAIALEILEIADDEMTDVQRAKLKCEMRLKLLAKWDPKRYGDKVQTEISGPDGKAIQTAHGISEDLQDAILTKTALGTTIAAGVTAPASFRGEGSEE